VHPKTYSLAHAIEHTETRINEGRYEEGQYAYLDLTETELRIQDVRMSYEQLVSLIRSLHTKLVVIMTR
jgi:hypothetical protein